MKIFTSTILIGFSIAYALGQEQLIGIQGGLNYSNISSSSPSPYSKPKFGLISGLNYEYQFKSSFLIGTDLLYNQYGIKEIFNNGRELRINLNYLSLPIKFGYIVGRKFKTYGKLGLVPSYLINANLWTEIQTIKITNEFRKFDFSGLIEIGVEFDIVDNYVLFSSVSSRQSFTRLIFVNNNEPNEIKRNYGFSILLGLKYKFGQK